MVFGAINLTLTEIVILQLGAIILGVAVHFFMVSRRSLTKTIQDTRNRYTPAPKTNIWEKINLKPDALDELKQQASSLVASLANPKEVAPKAAFLPEREEKSDASSLLLLRQSLEKQQDVLASLMQKLDELEGETEDKKLLREENEDLQAAIEKLEMKLESKEAELMKLRQQEAVAQKMAARIDEVYKEFDVLQRKITSLESQSGRASAMAFELEDLKQSYDKLHKDLVRKQEKLEEVVAENQRLHLNLSEVEDKLAEANLQRQQLIKKVQFLQDLNNDMQNMSEASQKLQNELRRIGELESMLSMIAEERDQIVKRQKDK